jgi:hypothetical protein
VASPLHLVLIEAKATAYRALLPSLVPRLDIFTLSPLNLPDSLTAGSTLKKTTSCFGVTNLSIPPISANIVMAVI